MNYIKLINQFWKLRRSKRITSKQADLYFFLIQECNEQAWENPFECSNKLIIASIDMQEPTLIDARNRLKQLGLIDFKGGKRNEASPVYSILYLNELSKDRGANLNNLSRNRDESIANTEEKAGMNDEHIEETKLNKTETKGNDASASTTKSFKKFSEDDFRNDIRTANESLTLPPGMLHKFFGYWSERSASGMMKFQLEKTWETKRRLETWRDNQAKFERHGKVNPGSNPIVPGVSGPGRSIVRDAL